MNCITGETDHTGNEGFISIYNIVSQDETSTTLCFELGSHIYEIVIYKEGKPRFGKWKEVYL